MDANALRNVMEQREREGQQPAPRPARNQQALDPRRPSDTEAPERPRTREELQRQFQRSNGEIRLRAPEADVKPNDLARRAAERSAPPKAAALAAAAERQSQENVIKRRITEQNIRRSDQDFGTRIRDGSSPATAAT
ncbi:flagellar motor protein MotB [Paracoccus yeei]|uniref:Flagellar motor protein MotB n=1 Tax=Paracoccus yeei TaxID=147645 RepID=A0A386UI17_9RHOB|nr:flagellar motor protein MotB [Paracoccus yeei]